VHELAEARASAVVRGRDADATAPLAHYERLIVPIRSGGRVGALGVYWDDVQAPDPAAVAAELEDLVTAAFPADAPQAEPSQPAGHVAFDVTLELVPLVRAIAEAAVGRCAADGAAVSVHEPSEHGQVIATLHLADYEERWVEPIVSAATAGPSITRYVDPDGSVPEDDDGAIATTIVVPLRDAEGDQVGNVVAVWRRDLRNEVDARLAELEAIVQDARAVLDNAIRFRRLQALAVRDPATGVFDQRYFAGALADACAAADLHADPLLVVTVAAVDLGPATTPVEVAALDRSLAGTAARFAAAVGERGVTCRANLGTFAAIVPGGTATQGSELVDEIRALLSAPPADEPPVTWHLGFVERAPAEDADALWRRALDALVPAREPSQLARAAGT
jgi:GGDEF domain-containing protein